MALIRIGESLHCHIPSVQQSARGSLRKRVVTALRSPEQGNGSPVASSSPLPL